MTYDAAGNVMNDGNGNQPTHDAENRIATDAGVTYSYDADGARMEKSSGTKYWFGPGGEALTETSLSGTINEEYIYFNGERIARVDRPSGTANYYFSNHLGSASVITSATAVIQEQMDFYPFGGVAYSNGSDPNHYKFTGKEWDSESNLDNFGARYFASTMGRFMTPDWAARPTAVPYALFGDPQSLNLYTYVRNDPVTRADADGHCGGGPSDSLCTAKQTGAQNEKEQGKDQAQNTVTAATVGAVIGGVGGAVVGGIAGGAGGTLVEPGGGTAVGIGLGGTEGAKDGAALGALIGATLGVIYSEAKDAVSGPKAADATRCNGWGPSHRCPRE
jgi:RHS repeat-associated protein